MNSFILENAIFQQKKIETKYLLLVLHALLYLWEWNFRNKVQGSAHNTDSLYKNVKQKK